MLFTQLKVIFMFIRNIGKILILKSIETSKCYLKSTFLFIKVTKDLLFLVNNAIISRIIFNNLENFG